MKENYSGGPRSASISFSLPDESLGNLVPAEPFVVEQTYEADYRTLIQGESGQVTINDPGAFFEGIVISDKDNANVETTPNSAPNATDYTVNAKTAYVQMLDGSYGYRLQFNSAADNTLARRPIPNAIRSADLRPPTSSGRRPARRATSSARRSRSASLPTRMSIPTFRSRRSSSLCPTVATRTSTKAISERRTTPAAYPARSTTRTAIRSRC